MMAMPYPVAKLDGMTAQAAGKLRKQGIRTTDKLIEVASLVRSRRRLAKATGILEAQLLEWVNIAHYLQIKGMGAAKAKLIRATGVNTVRDLGIRNPANLAQRMREYNNKLKLVGALPSETSVKLLIERARKHDGKITY
jgi:fructose-1,6-bisphosphatase/sedoheptulose 1,7-bisphosphatase-like protein